MAFKTASFDDDKLLEAFEKATKVYNFCPNRVWAIVESSDGKEKELRNLFPTEDKRLDSLFGHSKNRKATGDQHDRCTFDFCEHSLLNFTSVKQRHESRYCSHIACKPITNINIFPEDALNNAAEEKRPTAWHLYGRRINQPHQKFMAISHVWSDGTGTGPGKGQDGKVNRCLFNFFRDVAFELDCEGLWWDTICIPTDKAARSLAIQNMQANYEQAEVTLVHDCFLRDLPWTDAETACLAIVVSPWFSRGWTALELARSRTVKVLFKGESGHILKDLDDDILRDPQTVRHTIISGIIQRLRTQTIKGVDDLLCVLRSRYTSWAKDMATISAFLVGAAIEPEDELSTELEDEPVATEKAKNVYQQDIFERVVKHIGSVEYGHLFHNLPTMFDGASWCPARLLSLQPTFWDNANPISQGESASHADQPPLLQVDRDGNVVGTWKIFPTSYTSLEEYDWRDVHPLIAARIRSSLKRENSYRILVEPLAKSVVRALVVKVLREPSENNFYQFIGSVYFKQPQKLDENLDVGREITILNRLDNQQTRKIKTELNGVKQILGNSNQSQLPQTGDSDGDEDEDLESPSHLRNGKLSPYENFGYLDYGQIHTPSIPPRRYQQTPWDQDLLLAAKDGRERDALQLLNKGADSSIYDMDLRTPMSWAAINGHGKIVAILLNSHRDRMKIKEHNYLESQNPKEPFSVIDYWSQRFLHQFDSEDKHGRTPLSYAASYGHIDIVNQLIHWYEINIDSAEENGWTPLTFAVAGGNVAVAKLLLGAGANVHNLVRGDFSLLAVAAKAGSVPTAKLLLELGVQIDGSPGSQTPLFLAARDGNQGVLKLLITKGAEIDFADENGSALLRAVEGGHTSAVQLLLEKGKDRLNVNMPSPRWGLTALSIAVLGGVLWSPTFSSIQDEVKRGQKDTVSLLLSTETIDVNVKNREKATPVHMAASHGDDAILKLLLDTGKANIDAQTDSGITPLYYAAMNGHETTVEMLLKEKADVNIKTLRSSGVPAQAPLDIARENGYSSIVDRLKPYTSKTNRLFGRVEKMFTGPAVSESREDYYRNS